MQFRKNYIVELAVFFINATARKACFMSIKYGSPFAEEISVASLIHFDDAIIEVVESLANVLSI